MRHTALKFEADVFQDGLDCMGCSRPIDPSATFVSRELSDLYHFWLALAGERPLPARSDIDVLDLKPWISHVMLVDILSDPCDIRFRVIGTWIVERIGRDDTGKSMREIGLTPPRKRILDSYLDVARTMTPHTSQGHFYDRSQVHNHLNAERLLLPLSEDGVRCDKILSAIYFIPL